MIWAVLVAGGLVLRLVDLGVPFHHDESQVAYFSWLYWRDHDYEYNPLLHGPWQYMLTAATFTIGGVTDFTARLAPALMGTAMVALPFLARESLGRVAALTASLLFAVSPTALYYSRFAREDIHIATLTLAAVIVALRFLDRPRAWHPVAVLGLLAATLTVKESGLVFGALGTIFVVAVLIRQGRQGTLARAVAAVPRWSWVGAALCFAAVYAFLFSSLGAHPAGIWDGIYEGPKYWLDQHDVRRGGEPWFFHLVLLGAYELPVVVLGIAGALVVLRRPSIGTLFLVVWFAGSLAFYSWAGEKYAWLVIHPLVPLVLLAGLGMQAVWTTPRRRLRAAGLVLATIGALFLGYSSWRVNADRPTSPREVLVNVQSTDDVNRFRDRVLAIPDAAVAVDPSESGGFPWPWSFRDLAASYDPAVGEPSYRPIEDVVILSDAHHRELPGYSAERIALRGYRRGFHRLTPNRWWDWFVHRRPLGPLGENFVWVYVHAP